MASARRVGTNESISTYGGAGMGRDYTLLSTWEAATDTDLVTGEVSPVLHCYDDEVFDDNIVLSGATTSNIYFRIIRPAPGNFHDGTKNKGVRFSNTSQPIAFILGESNSQIQDLVITSNLDGAGASVAGGAWLGGSGSLGAFVGCIIHSCENTGAGGDFCIFANSTPSTSGFVIDCLIADAVNNDGIFINDGGFTLIVYNTTFVGNARYGLAQNSGTILAKNCLSSGNVTADFQGSFSGSSVNNASSDATAPGTSSRTMQTFTFIDAGSDDYHLAPSDTGALGFGVDLSSDGNYAFNDDIDRETIITWSIGFNSVIQALSQSSVATFLRRRRR